MTAGELNGADLDDFHLGRAANAVPARGLKINDDVSHGQSGVSSRTADASSTLNASGCLSMSTNARAMTLAAIETTVTAACNRFMP